MMRALRSTVCWTTVFGLLLLVSSPGAAASPGARLEGMLLGVDGRPAAGHHVVLVDGAGDDVDATVTDADGVYSFRGLAAGEYGVVVEGPEGGLGGLAGEPLRLEDGQLARQDLRLLEADDASTAQMKANYGLKQRYAGMSTAEKSWLWVVVGVVGGLTLYLIFDSNNNESNASDFQPLPQAR